MPKYMDLEIKGEISFEELVKAAAHEPEETKEDEDNATNLRDS